MAAPVLLISSDPFLGASLDAIARGRVRVARLDPARRPAAWPGEPGAVVVLDVTARQRDAAYAWVRRHHPGPLVVLLKPGERDPALPPDPDPDRLVIGRPFRLSDLAEVLEHASSPAEVEARPDPGARDLLTASAEQRRRRLGSLATPAPAARATGAEAAAPAAPPDVDPGLPRPDWPTAATRLEVRRPPPPRRGRGRRVLGRVLLGLAVVLLAAGAWLAFGLLEAREDLAVVAGAVRAELTRAEAALVRGDPATARTAVRAASRNLDLAAALTERRELRVAARLPVLSGTVGDARHLLAAGRHLVRAGDRATVVAARLGPDRSAAPGGGRFDLTALAAAAGQGRRLLADLERARAELEQVRGGPLAPGAGEARRWALGRLDEARARAAAFVPTLAALPDALGAERPRTYLVVLTAPAGPSGGGSLAGLELVLDGGVAAVRPGGDELAGRLDDGGAGLPAAARRLLDAGAAPVGAGPDGVVAIHPAGARALLAATGPVEVPGLGRLDAAGDLDGLTRGRADRERLLGALLGRLLAGPDLLATGRAVGAAGARGQLQVHAADPSLRRALAHHRLDGTPAPARR